MKTQDPQLMRLSKSSSKRKLYSNTILLWETRKKISNKQLKLTPKATRVRRKNKTQSQQKEIIEITAKINLVIMSILQHNIFFIINYCYLFSGTKEKLMQSARLNTSMQIFFREKKVHSQQVYGSQPRQNDIYFLQQDLIEMV